MENDTKPTPEPAPTPPSHVKEGPKRGCFAKGNKFGVGNKYAQKAQKYKVIAYQAVTPKDWRDIVDKAIDDAKQGDFRARLWISELLLGKAKQTIDATIASRPAAEISQQINEVLGMSTESNDEQQQ